MVLRAAHAAGLLRWRIKDRKTHLQTDRIVAPHQLLDLRFRHVQLFAGLKVDRVDDAVGKTYAGLIQIDGNYYYVNSYCKVITNQRYWVSKTNDLLPAAFYNFDAEGKMTDAPIPTPDPDPNPDPNPEVKNGIVSEDGELYYYVDGVKTYAGLIQIDGDYYYVNSYCKVITSQRYWVSKTNNLLPATFYTFGADGKMVR